MVSRSASIPNLFFYAGLSSAHCQPIARYSRRYFQSSIRPHALPVKRVPHAKYGGCYTVTSLPGDGIGPEMLGHIRRIFRFANIPVDFEEIELSSKDPSNEVLENAITAIQRNGLAIKGNIETKFDDPTYKSPKHHDLDLVLIRENTEGEYSGLEHESVKGIVESIKIVTRRNIEKIARFAFDYAVLNNRPQITAIHKANIQKLGDGLFLQVCKEVAETEYKNAGLQFNSMIVDNACMQLVSFPQQFNNGILLMPNLYGNIISNIACGLVGGPGLVSGMNIGEEYAVFETGTRNTGTSLAGKDIANPTAFIRASIDMLRYLELHDYADKLSDALYKALTEQRTHTPDIGGTNHSTEVVQAVINNYSETISNA
ncbi:hypothetical protein niasHT_001554 [Heterodera trifolii]|uniref:Isopropylmalate dehydrogenase-like domain-containing protein n=1 Tax=Heterodera trifolii TaxID=157864 RepID=A0ABD2MB12_9BILA